MTNWSLFPNSVLYVLPRSWTVTITSRTLTAISDLSTTTQQLVNADTPINGGERDPGDIPSSNESSGEGTNLTRIDSAPFYEQLWDWQTSVLTRVNLELRRCDPCNGPCDCVCHLRQEWRLSNLLRGVLGSMFVGYSGLAFLKPTCNVEACKGSRGRSITVKYLFPSWFTARAFHFAANTCFGGPKFYLFVQKRVPEFGVNTLNSLVRNGNIEGARKLLEAREACPNDAETARGRSALHLAIAGGHIELTKLLMSFGADLDLQDDEGISPIQRVAWHIFTKRVNYGQAQNIFTSTAYIESVELTAVHKAVLSVIHVDLNQFLSLPEHGSLIDEADANLRTPLHWAASVGNCQAVKVLLQHKAETSKRDYCGDTPLIKAVSRGCLDCVKELLVSQADINEANPKGEKPIHFAAQQSVPMVECLLQARANINDTTAANYTPFDFAVMANRTEVGVYLLQRGVDANRGASNGRSPIFCALRCQSYECIEMLLSLPEIELSIPDGEGNSVLHWVARMQDVRIIEIIRAVKPRGLTIEDANSEGETALDLAKRWAGITPEFLVAFQNLLEDIGAGWSDMNDGEEFFDAEENLMS